MQKPLSEDAEQEEGNTMKTNYVKRLRTNVRKGCDHELSPCTAIVGRNGAGKSTVIDALSLALRGTAYTPGLGKDPKVLVDLKPDFARELEIRS